jgi:hypothetical protein
MTRKALTNHARRFSFISSLVAAALLLSACGNGSQVEQSNNDPARETQARPATTNQPVMGHVRWYDRESRLSRVECSESDDHWQYNARNAEVWLRASRNQKEPERAPTARTVIQLTIYREDEPNLGFHMLDNMTDQGKHLIGQVEAGPEGIAGRTLMTAANSAAGRDYPFPEGIEIEFELNCP